MRFLLILFLTFSLMTVNAQDASTTTGEDEIQSEKIENEKNEKKPKNVETPDSFDATEKLSEDIPAPFPVDI
ncbi:MAG: hypothetical protein ACI9SC_000081 [Gammaproteobacteria bacterium]|jgi:hypothetical protein